MSWMFSLLPLLCFEFKCSLANQVGKAGPSIFSCLVLSLSRFVWILLNWRRGRKGNRLPATTERKQPSNRVDWLAANHIHHLPGRLSKRKPLGPAKSSVYFDFTTRPRDTGAPVRHDWKGQPVLGTGRPETLLDSLMRSGNLAFLLGLSCVLCCVCVVRITKIINSRSSSFSISGPNHSDSSKACTCYFPRIIFPRLAALPRRLVPGNKVGRPHLARQISCAAIEFPPTFQGPIDSPQSMSSISVLLLVLVPQLVPKPTAKPQVFDPSSPRVL